MKRIVRDGNSTIVSSGYTYPAHRTEILNALDLEQNNFCAYTEEYYSPGYARDVEHFNPTLKNTVSDGYGNWFSASSRINRRKGSKSRWNRYQPILMPTSLDLESRLLYKDGYYILSNPNDVDAKNLRDYLFLNDFGLPVARIAYIDTLKFLFTVADFRQ